MPRSVAAPMADDSDDDDVEVPSIEEMTVQAERPRRPRAPRMAPPPQPRRWGAIIGWASFAVVLLAFGGGAVFARSTVMDLWPPASKVYELVGLAKPQVFPLVVGDIVPSQTLDGATPVIVIAGMISNITAEVQPVPKLRGALLDVRGREIFNWTFDAPVAQLAAHETHDFTTRVPNPPEAARGVAVTFEVVVAGEKAPAKAAEKAPEAAPKAAAAAPAAR